MRAAAFQTGSPLISHSHAELPASQIDSSRINTLIFSAQPARSETTLNRVLDLIAPRGRPIVILSGLACLLTFAAPAVAEETFRLSLLDLTLAKQGYGKPQADRSVDGHPLTLRGETFEHGFGTHSPGLLLVSLHGKARRFLATVGIDDEAGAGRGSAEFQILADGVKLLWRSGIMHRGDAPKAVDLDVTGVQLLALRVTDGGDGFEYDHADWADARFIADVAPAATAIPAAGDVSIAPPASEPAPVIRPPFAVGVRPRTPLLWTVPATGDRPLSFTARHLPPGLKIDVHTGTLSGIVERAGDYTVEIGVKNRAGQSRRAIHVVVGDRLALTPPMGWNSYDFYGDRVTEEETLANARYLAQHMQPVGWDTVVVDYRWYDPDTAHHPDNGSPGQLLAMDGFGRLLPADSRFPSAANGAGFKPLADRIHAMGLRFGIHIMRGIPRNAVEANLPVQGSQFHAADAANTQDLCPWCPDMYGVRGDTAAGRAYYDSLFRLYAEWGVDYVKMDDTSSPYHAREIEAVHDAIAKCGRSIVYSLSPGETPVENGSHVAVHANLWRVSGDFWDNWNSLDHEFALAQRWQPFVAAGSWPDADMLPVGHLSQGGRPVGPDRKSNLTHAEQVTLLSLWALLPSPLMVGANLPDNDAWTLSLLTNPEVLAINQDASGAAAVRCSAESDGEIWAKRLADGTVAVGLFNKFDLPQQVAAAWSALRITGRWKARDCWQRKDLGPQEDRVAMVVPGHGAVLLLLSPAK
jgi:alpha-galactosidase